MALSQRLEFRQTQALVMTPQLMQAIKLLQLSNLDLAAYVEGELERNPLLERADDEEAPAAAAEPEAGEGDDDSAPTPDWIGDDLETSRSSMEEGLGTELDNVFPDDSNAKAAASEAPPPAYSEWSGAAARPPARRLQSGSLRVGRDHARRPSRRAAGAGRSPIRPAA